MPEGGRRSPFTAGEADRLREETRRTQTCREDGSRPGASVPSTPTPCAPASHMSPYVGLRPHCAPGSAQGRFKAALEHVLSRARGPVSHSLGVNGAGWGSSAGRAPPGPVPFPLPRHPLPSTWFTVPEKQVSPGTGLLKEAARGFSGRLSHFRMVSTPVRPPSPDHRGVGCH